MTPAQVAHIMALVDQYAATRNAGYIGSFGTPAEARAAIEAAHGIGATQKGKP